MILNSTTHTLPFNLHADLRPFDIAQTLTNHSCDLSRLSRIFDVIQNRIDNFDPEYSPYLADHLEWTSSVLSEFMTYRGYNAVAANAVKVLFKYHDSGKTLQPGLWKITEGKQERTEYEKAERPKHGLLGIDILRAAIEEVGIDIGADEAALLGVMEYFMVFHHEKLHGGGPFGMKGDDMCRILRMATIVDTFHGKLKTGKPASDILTAMTEGKHEGEFDLNLLDDFGAFLKTRPTGLEMAASPAYRP